MFLALVYENETIAERQSHSLGQIGVNCGVTKVGLVGNLADAIIFPATDLEKVECHLMLDRSIPRVSTDDPTTTLLVDRTISLLDPRNPNASVAFATAKALSQELGVRFILLQSYGGTAPPCRADGVLRVHFFSTPVIESVPTRPPQVQQVASVFGHPVAMQVLTPSGFGVPVISANENLTVAERLDESMFVLCDLLGTPPNFELVFELMYAVLSSVRPVDRSKEPQDQRERYVRLCGRRSRIEYTLLEHRCAELNQEIDRTGKLLSQLYSEREEKLIELQRVKEKRALKTTYMDEFDRILSMPHVLRMDINEDILVIHTDCVILRYDGNAYEMGPFELRLPLCANGTASIISRKPKRMPDGSLCHHPHSFGPEGATCFGELTAPLAKLLMRRQIPDAVSIILHFVHQLNPLESYVKALQLWEPMRSQRSCSCKISTTKKG